MVLPNPNSLTLDFNYIAGTYALSISQDAPFNVTSDMKIVVSNGLQATCSQAFTLEYAPRCNKNPQVVSWTDQSAEEFAYFPQNAGATVDLDYLGFTAIGFKNNYPNACPINTKFIDVSLTKRYQDIYNIDPDGSVVIQGSTFGADYSIPINVTKVGWSYIR